MVHAFGDVESSDRRFVALAVFDSLLCSETIGQVGLISC